LNGQIAALKRRAEECDARKQVHEAREAKRDLMCAWVKRYDFYSIMAASATRVEQLVIERHLRITSAELDDMGLWTLDHCADAVADWRDGAVPTGTAAADDDEDDIPIYSPITADMVAAIEAALPAMRAEMATIESNADVAAGIAKWRHSNREVDCDEPGYGAGARRQLNDIAEIVCETPDELRITIAMLRAYAAQLVVASSAPTHDLMTSPPLMA